MSKNVLVILVILGLGAAGAYFYLKMNSEVEITGSEPVVEHSCSKGIGEVTIAWDSDEWGSEKAVYRLDCVKQDRQMRAAISAIETGLDEQCVKRSTRLDKYPAPGSFYVIPKFRKTSGDKNVRGVDIQHSGSSRIFIQCKDLATVFKKFKAAEQDCCLE